MVAPFNKRWSEWKLTDLPAVGTGEILPGLISLIDDMDHYVGGSIYVHCILDPDRALGNLHRVGMAADLHIGTLHPLDQFVVAGRFGFTGIGVYGSDVWRHPGLHVDVRVVKVGARWGCRERGPSGTSNTTREYVALDKAFISGLLDIMP